MNALRLLKICLLFFSLIPRCAAYNILVLPLGQKSHLFSLMSLSEALTAKGHHVYFVLRDDFTAQEVLSSENELIHIVQYKAKFPEFFLSKVGGGFDSFADDILRMSLDGEMTLDKLLQMAAAVMETDCRQILMNSEDMMQVLSRVKFDVTIIDGVFMNRCNFLVPHRLGIPWVTYTDYVEPWLVRVPWLPSFVPNQFTSFTDEMDFFQRMKNTLIEFFLPNFDSLFSLSNAADVYDHYRQYGDFRSLTELVKRSKLFISSRNNVLDYVKPSISNLIDAGGLTTRPPRNLSQSIRDFIDGSKMGVILVTFGSMGRTLPRTIAERFLRAFERLDGYRLLWKFENTDNLTIPKEVRTERWLPQQDILAHPKTKLFITHCGNNGQLESVFHGVPMLGFPLQGDEAYNARRIEHKGYGISMNIHEFTSEQLYKNIIKILTDPSFKSRTSLASAIMKSAPMSPAENAAHWIEHVIKFGSEHLESAGKDLGYFQYYMFDVMITLQLVLVVSLYTVYKIICWLIRKAVRSGKRNNEPKTNKEKSN